MNSKRHKIYIIIIVMSIKKEKRNRTKQNTKVSQYQMHCL